MRIAPLLALLPFTLAAEPAAAPGSVLILGDALSEAAHKVVFERAELVSGSHPARWVNSVRASAALDSPPSAVIDGNAATVWRVSGPPPKPLEQGNWIELDLNQPVEIRELTIHWLGREPYAYKIYDRPSFDSRRLVQEGVSRGQDDEPETIVLPEAVRTRAIRVEFAVPESPATQGVRELRIGGLPEPAAYPPAAYKDAPVEIVRRVYYVEPGRLVVWPIYNPKIPHADGGSARRLLPGLEPFEGGRIDLTLAVTPRQANWITLKLWESNPRSMIERGDLVVVQALGGDGAPRGRGLPPAFVTEQQHTEQEWYGAKPQPGRWSYAHYKVPADLVGGRTTLRLRLQGVGNVRQDHPMRGPTPPIYLVTAALTPTIPE